MSAAAGVPFRRPSRSVFHRLGNFMMPPQSPDQVLMGFGDLKVHFRLKHHLTAIAILPIFFAMFMLQAKLWGGVLLYSPLLLFLLGATWAYSQGWLYLIGFIALVMYVPRLVPGGRDPVWGFSTCGDTVGRLNQAAVTEEQWFREGAERWSRFERFRSAFAFGFMHQGNLFYPFATILPITLAGLMLNHVYLRNYKRTHCHEQAVLASSVAHRVYNRIALWLLAVWLVVVVLPMIIPWIPNVLT